MAASIERNRWPVVEAMLANRWLGVTLVGLLLVAVLMSIFEAWLGLHPGLNVAFAIVLLGLLTWSAVGVRAAVGEPGVARWRRLLELAEMRGTIAGVEVDVDDHPLPELADIAPDAHLYVVDPYGRVALPLLDASSDAVVFGPRVCALDEATRTTLLDDARRALRPGGHVAIVLPAREPRSWFWIGNVDWEPGSEPGWWSDALGERFVEVRHAPLTRRLDVVLATREA